MPNWHSYSPLGIHRDPLNLYEARPKTGNDTSLEYVTIGACTPCEPVRNKLISFKRAAGKTCIVQVVHSDNWERDTSVGFPNIVGGQKKGGTLF